MVKNGGLNPDLKQGTRFSRKSLPCALLLDTLKPSDEFVIEHTFLGQHLHQ